MHVVIFLWFYILTLMKGIEKNKLFKSSLNFSTFNFINYDLIFFSEGYYDLIVININLFSPQIIIII